MGLPSGTPPSSPSTQPATGRSRGKIANEIIEYLRSQIAAGTLARSERLPNERALADYFGVSQPTVREATRALEAMGLIEVRHGSGAYVSADPQSLLATSI